MTLTATRPQTPEVDALVESYLPLARRLALRYRYSSIAREDLEQVAALALVKAARRFDRERGRSFAAFAVPTVLGELRRHIRDHGWAMRVPRGLQEDFQRVGKAREVLTASLGRSPSPREVAEHTGEPVERVLEAMDAGRAFEAESLYLPASDDADSEPLLDRAIAVEETGYELVEYGASIGAAWRDLRPQERAIVALRFVEDLTQSEIATRLGLSQMQVSRLLRRALDRLRSAASDDGLAA